MQSTTIKTPLEYAVMPIQAYEFSCSHCGLIASYRAMGASIARGTRLCTDCLIDWKKGNV
jgi:hypothetical protein